MAFLEKMGETLVAKSRDVADKAKEMAEVNRLKGQVNSQKSLADKIYAEIGRMIYENREDWSSVDVSGQMEQLDSIQAETARLQEEILRVRGIRRCDNCGTEIAKNATVCPKCGTAVVVQEEAEGEREGGQTQEERRISEAQQSQDGQRISEAQQSQEAQQELTVKLCPSCHKKMEPEMVFCPFCGARI